MKKRKKFDIIDGETLADMELQSSKFCVDTLLPQGVTILGGAPKVGKSWLVMDLCVRVANGEPIWNLQTHRGTTLYLCLEDPLYRVQERLNRVTEDPPANAFFATVSDKLGDGLCEQIQSFVEEHPDIKLIAVDTFQIIRENSTDASYANDYEEVQKLKQLADDLKISLLLVHHLRKQGDSDPLNKISGTTGISGAVDAVFVLDKDKRNGSSATLVCTGREIEDRELELKFSKETCTWNLVADSIENPEVILPQEILSLIELMKQEGSFSGSNGEFTEKYNSFCGTSISAKGLKQKMNQWRGMLKECGVMFESSRSNGQRMVDVIYVEPTASRDESDVSDAKITTPKTCVTCVP